MKKTIQLFFIFFCTLLFNSCAMEFQEQEEPATHEIPAKLLKLKNAYPDQIKSVETNAIVWMDGSKMIYDDGIQRSGEDLLNQADLKEQMEQDYIPGKNFEIPAVDFEPGRTRNEAFFKKIYGQTEEEARKNLLAVKWLPSSLNQTIYASKINGVADKLQKISNELDKMPAFKMYLSEIGGTFNWRVIKGTNRLSPHSFGIAIDINVANSDYWLNNPTVNGKIVYKNRIPLEIVLVFEKYGFIWGGKWYHYDTMHFEYRPELMPDL